MSYHAAAVRDAIRDVLIGAVGAVRIVPDDRMAANVFDGQRASSRHARALLADHRFDVKIGRLRNHEASPVGAIGSYRIAEADITIDVLTATKTVAQEDERDDILATVASDMDDAIQALAFPTNVAASAALEATGIISGMLLGPGGEGSPEWAEVSQDWKAQEIRSRLTCSALLRIHQLALDTPTPMHIFGESVRAWYRADVVSQASSLATEWLDNSGNLFGLAPTTAGQTLSVDPTSSISGLQSLVSLGAGFFDAYRVRSTQAVLAANAPPNVFVIGRFTALNSGSVESVIDARDSLNASVFSIQADTDGFIAFTVDGTTATSVSQASAVVVSLYEALHDGAIARVRVNDSAQATAGVAPSNTAVAALTVPGPANNAAFEYFEILILNAYPTAAQVTAYRTYANTRYALGVTP